MEKQYIQFKKQREIGEILTDTFKFLRENFKQLFGLVLKIAGPALLVALLAIGYYMFTTFGSFSILNTQNASEVFGPAFFGGILISFVLIFVSMIVYFSLLYGTVLNFIKSYIKNEGKADSAEVRHGAINDFWNLTGASMLTGVMIFFGLLVCILPGFYLMVPLSLVFSLIVFNKMSIADSISNCFQLIKSNWWVTFATLLVIWLLLYIIGIVFSMPALLYSFIKAFLLSQETSITNPMEMFDWVYILLNLIAYLVQYLLYTVMAVATVFIYFNLNEKQNFTGTYETIENLGEKDL